MPLSQEPHAWISPDQFTKEMESLADLHGEEKIHAIIKKQLPEVTITYLAAANDELLETVRYNILKALKGPKSL